MDGHRRESWRGSIYSNLLIRLLAIVVGVVIVFLLGCSKNNEAASVVPSATSAPLNNDNVTGTVDEQSGDVIDEQTQGEEKLEIVRWGTTTFKADSAYLALGVEKGFFREQGIDIEWVLNDSASTLMRGIFSGDIDVGEFNPLGVLDAVAEGAGVKLVGSTLAGMNHLLMARSDIKTPHDLEGRTVNILAPNSLFDMMLTLYMKENGADPSKVVKAGVGGSGVAFQALIAGKVDAAATTPEYAAQFEGDPNFHVLAKYSEELPLVLRFTLNTTDDFIRNHGDLLQRFMYARSKTLRYAVENPEETLEFARQLPNMPNDEKSIALPIMQQIEERLLRPDLEITNEQLQYMIDARMMMDPAKKNVTVDQVYDGRFQEQVVRELGAWEW